MVNIFDILVNKAIVDETKVIFECDWSYFYSNIVFEDLGVG